MTQVTADRTTREPADDDSWTASTPSLTGPRTGNVHRVVRNSVLNLAGQGLYALFYLVVIAGLARGLGKEGFGEYYTLFALMLVVQVVCEAGVSTVLTRRLAGSLAHSQVIIKEAAGLFMGIALTSIVVFLGLGACGVGGVRTLPIGYASR